MAPTRPPSRRTPAGSSFARALAQHPREFDASYRAVVAAGEQGGQLGAVLDRLATDLEERERLVADLGTRNAMILRNHGTLALGASPGEAWSGIYQLESACTAQVRSLSVGRDNVLIAPEEAQAASYRVAGMPVSPAAPAT